LVIAQTVQDYGVKIQTPKVLIPAVFQVFRAATVPAMEHTTIWAATVTGGVLRRAVQTTLGTGT
jgi:hypothetical protein